MSFEEYRNQLKQQLKEADWKNPRDPEGPAAKLLKQAAADRDVNVDEFGELTNVFYGERVL